MSRRNQARRRRAYGRRQHEVRQRRDDRTFDLPGDWFDGPGGAFDELPRDHGPDGFDGGRQGRAAA